MSHPKGVILYTDGACLGNPGPGGYGVVILNGNSRRELCGGFRLTTNNRMELMAAIVGLRALDGHCRVTLYTDSFYVAEAMTKGWARQWQANRWRRQRGKRVLNADLWEQLLALCDRHEVEFVWIRGHAEHAENQRCDELARQAARELDLPPDTGYEMP